MDILTIGMLLEYLYKKFLVSFILALIGSFMKESLKTAKLKKMDLMKIMVSAIFSSVIICALVDYIKIPFGIYAAVCVIAGMWGYQLLSLALNATFMKKFLCNLFKNTKASALKSLSDTLEQPEKDAKDKKEVIPEKVEDKQADPDDQ